MEQLKRDTVDRLADTHPKCDRDALYNDLTSIIDEARAEGTDEAAITEQLKSWYVQLPRRRHHWISPNAALADLRALLIGPQSRQAKTWHTLRRIAEWIFDHYVPAAGLVVLSATAFYGLACAYFYESLNITPEQVGLSPAQVVAHSAAGGVTLMTLIATGIFCAVVPIVPMREDPASQSERGTWRGVLLNAILTVVGLVVLFILSRLLIPRLVVFASLAWFPIAIFALASFRLRRDRWRLEVTPKPLLFGLDRYLIALVALAVPVGLLFTGLTTITEADRLGRQARAGEAVRDPSILGVPFLGVRVEPALISWNDRKPPSSAIPRCAFYLGKSGDIDLFFDHRSNSTFQVPASEVTVEVRNEMSNCEAPINVLAPLVHTRRNGDLFCDPGRWQSTFSPRFSYRWMTEGIFVEDDKNPDRVFSASTSWPGRIIRCRVTGRTVWGSDTAVSPRVAAH